MSLSPVDPLERAWNELVLILIDTGSFIKWLLLGFTAMLAHLAEMGGTGFYFDVTNPRFLSEFPPSFQNISGEHMLSRNMDMPSGFMEGPGLALFLAFLMGGVVLGIVLIWLRSRGEFVFLDNIVRNEGALVEPWSGTRSEGNSLFLFYLIAYSIGIVLASSMFFLFSYTIHTSSSAGEARWLFILPIAIGGILLGIAWILFEVIMNYFVVPIMYLKEVTATRAWGIFYNNFLTRHPFSIFGFFLFLTLIFISGIILYILLGIMTCCIGLILLGLPYVGHLLLLPLYVFTRCYNLYFLQQAGSQWQFFPVTTETGSNRESNIDSGT